MKFTKIIFISFIFISFLFHLEGLSQNNKCALSLNENMKPSFMKLMEFQLGKYHIIDDNDNSRKEFSTNKQVRTIIQKKVTISSNNFIYERESPVICQTQNFESNIILYPNPTFDIINICNTKSNSFFSNIILYDIRGNQIGIYPVISSFNKIDVSSFPCGIYFIRLENEGIQKLYKFQKNE